MNIAKPNFQTFVINIFANFCKEELPTSILTTTFGKKIEDVALIDVDAYCLVLLLKSAQIFAISIRGLKFQAEKKARPKTNLKIVVLKKYHNLLDVFLKKNSDSLFIRVLKK